MQKCSCRQHNHLFGAAQFEHILNPPMVDLAFPRFYGKVDQSTAMALRQSIDDQPDKDPCRSRRSKKQGFYISDLTEGLSCTAVAQRLEIPISSLTKWCRKARINRDDFGQPEQDQLTAKRGLSWQGCARKTASSGGKKIFQAGGSTLSL